MSASNRFPAAAPTNAEAATLRTPVSEKEFAATLPVASVEVIGASGNSEPRIVDPAPHPLSGDRYAPQRTLGVGGMGEVLLCRDAFLGRDVAMKVMREAGEHGSEGRARFLREARVQGQLEHPSVVPVYDIATGAGGAPYFTMKRIQGLTLRTILDRLAQRDEATVASFGRRKLLSALAQASLAVAFAHKRGVLHRDLKPENLMLGEFGEVYVLDWGVARPSVNAGEDEPPMSVRARVDVLNDGLPTTEVGSLVGTPGYMSPEQAKGDVDALSTRSDVYSLGCILFEVLTLRPLHDARDVPALILSTIVKPAPKASEVAPDHDVPPELDLLCARSLALDPAERLSSARAFADALERYMDGERDAEMRKALASSHLEAARAALEVAATGGADADEARTRGMRELGKALALDPSSVDAMQLVTRVVMAAPSELPPAAEAALKDVELQDRAAGAKRMLYAYAMWALFVPFVSLCGVKSWALTIALDFGLLAVALYSFWMSWTRNVHPRYMRFAILANTALVSLMSVVCGPFFLVPGMACVVAASFLVSLRPNMVTRRMITIFTLASVLLPAILEWTNVVPRSVAFEDGSIRVLPRMIYFPALPAQAFLVASAVVQILNVVILVGSSVQSLVAAERKNFALAYRLGQLLPVVRGDEAPRQGVRCAI